MTFDPGPLDAATSYYWRADTVTPAGVVEGPARGSLSQLVQGSGGASTEPLSTG